MDAANLGWTIEFDNFTQDTVIGITYGLLFKKTKILVSEVVFYMKSRRIKRSKYVRFLGQQSFSNIIATLNPASPRYLSHFMVSLILSVRTSKAAFPRYRQIDRVDTPTLVLLYSIDFVVFCNCFYFPCISRYLCFLYSMRAFRQSWLQYFPSWKFFCIISFLFNWK